MIKQLTVDGYKFKIEQYNGTNELLRDLKTRTRKSGGWHEPKFGSWSGIESREKLNDYLQNGYEAPVQKLREATKIKIKGDNKRISFKNDIVGGNPIVPLAIMGVPNNMINMRMKPIKCKVIDVYYDMTCACGIEARDIENAGEKVLGAILELEGQGYKFNLYTVNTYVGNRDCDLLAVKVKDSNQPFDLKRMAFSMMHPAFFRVCGFDWYGKCPVSKYKPAYGHALYYEVGTEKARNMMREIFGNAILFSAADIIKRGQEKDVIKEVLTNAK